MPRPFTSLALLRWLTAGVMLFAAVGKTAAPRELHEALAAFDVPAAALWPLAVLLLATEYAAAILLLRRSTIVHGAGLALFLSTGFLTVTAWRLAHGTPESCACFGLFLSLAPRQVLWLDVALVAASAMVLLSEWRPRVTANAPAAEPPPPDRSRRWALGFVAACLLVLGGGAYVVVEAEPLPAAGAPGTPLRFGQLAPHLDEIRGATEPGRWRLVYFTCPDCPEAGRMLDDVLERFRRRSTVLSGTIVVGGSGRAAVQRLVGKLQRYRPDGWRIIADDGDRLLDAYAGRPRRRPFAALLGQDGRVLQCFDGYSHRRPTLGDELVSLVADVPISAHDRGLYSVVVGRRPGEDLADRLSRDAPELWMRQAQGLPLVIGFVSMHCTSCLEFVRFINTNRGRPEVQTLVFGASPEDVALVRARANVTNTVALLGGAPERHGLAAFRSPAVSVVRHGRVIFANGPQSGMAELSAMLARAVRRPSGGTTDAPPDHGETL